MEHVINELNRLQGRLANGADPFEHAGLYAAQQALSWALNPSGFASPYDVVTRRQLQDSARSADPALLLSASDGNPQGGDGTDD